MSRHGTLGPSLEKGWLLMTLLQDIVIALRSHLKEIQAVQTCPVGETTRGRRGAVGRESGRPGREQKQERKKEDSCLSLSGSDT